MKSAYSAFIFIIAPIYALEYFADINDFIGLKLGRITINFYIIAKILKVELVNVNWPDDFTKLMRRIKVIIRCVLVGYTVICVLEALKLTYSVLPFLQSITTSYLTFWLMFKMIRLLKLEVIFVSVLILLIYSIVESFILEDANRYLLSMSSYMPSHNFLILNICWLIFEKLFAVTLK